MPVPINTSNNLAICGAARQPADRLIGFVGQQIARAPLASLGITNDGRSHQPRRWACNKIARNRHDDAAPDRRRRGLGGQHLATRPVDSGLIDRVELDIAQRSQDAGTPPLVAGGSRYGVETAQDRFAKGSSATTFAVPGVAQDLAFEGLCLFDGEGALSAFSAAPNADPGDRADDREASVSPVVLLTRGVT